MGKGDEAGEGETDKYLRKFQFIRVMNFHYFSRGSY